MPIECNNICKSYNGKTVLDHLNLSFPEGETSCIMGPSGGGKTTLLRIMAGLEAPDTGLVSGLENKRKSFVFQEDRLCENLSAAANIRLVCETSVTADDISQAMAAVGLSPDVARQTVRSLSGGQRRRVAILRALLADRDVLFMDEPFKELDAETKAKVMLYVRQQCRGKTVLFVTHDEGEREIMGGRLIICKE